MPEPINSTSKQGVRLGLLSVISEFCRLHMFPVLSIDGLKWFGSTYEAVKKAEDAQACIGVA